MVALGEAGGNLDGEVALDAIAAVRTEEDFDRHFIAGTHLAVGNPGIFDAGHAALRQHVDA